MSTPAAPNAPPPPPVLLLDTNVVLDVVLARAPHAHEAALLFEAIAQGRAAGFVAGHALTTVHYIAERERGRPIATTAVSDLLALLGVVPVGAPELQRALALGLRDFEDGVQAAACLAIGAEILVTRNAKDFRGAPVTTRTAGETLAILTARGE